MIVAMMLDSTAEHAGPVSIAGGQDRTRPEPAIDDPSPGGALAGTGDAVSGQPDVRPRS